MSAPRARSLDSPRTPDPSLPDPVVALLCEHRGELESQHVVLFGAGLYGTRVLQTLRALGISPSLVVDSDPGKTGMIFHGIPVALPNAINQFAPERLVVVVASVGSSIDICHQLKELGLSEPRHVLRCDAALAEHRNRQRQFAPKRNSGAVPLVKVGPALIDRIAPILAKTLFTAYFVLSRNGSRCGVSRWTKLRLAWRVSANRKHFRSLSRPVQHLMTIHELFKIPSTVTGAVVECGCYDGASTASLSLACTLVGRRLFVCDSFQGLPEPEQHEAVTIRSNSSFYRWEKGEFASPGGLEGVREKVRRHGAVDACEFIPGFFCDTLPTLPVDSVVLVFEDADLKSSVRDCLTYLWPRLRQGCKFFSHEPWSVDVVSLFYDDAFWNKMFGCPPPGFYGGDMGGFRGAVTYFKLGFAVKRDFTAIAKRGTRVRISGSL